MVKMLVLGDFQGVFSSKLANSLSKEDFDLIICVGDYAGIKEFRQIIIKRLKQAKSGKVLSKPEEIVGKEKWKEILKKDFEAGKNVFKKISSFNKPVIYVFGNADDEWYRYPFDKKFDNLKPKNKLFLSKLKNFYNITYSKKRFLGIDFIGHGGYMDIDAYFDKKNFKQANDKTIKQRLLRRDKSKKNFNSLLKNLSDLRIFVFHYPPKGVFDIIRDKKDNPMNGNSAGIDFFMEAIETYQPKIVFCGHMHEYQGMKKIGKSLIINPGDAENSKYALVDFDERSGNVKKVIFRK